MYWVITLVLILAYYNATVLSHMQQMYRYHRLEFKNHIKKMVALFISTEVSLLIFIGDVILDVYDTICLRAFLDEDGSHAMMDADAQRIGICYILKR